MGAVPFPAGGSKETLHQACAQAEGGMIFFLAAQPSAAVQIFGRWEH
jgi:hypothetical protein